MNQRRLFIAVAVLLLAGFSFPLNEVRAQYYQPPAIQLPSTTGNLVQTLRTNISWRRRAEAAELLGLSGDPRVLEALAQAAAYDTSPDVRRSARTAIRRIRGDISPLPPIPGPFPPVQPQDPNIALVDSWYQRYLGRSVDRGDLAIWVPMLQRGVSALDVQAGILSSNEFWARNGAQPGSFVVDLYQRVLNRTPNRQEIGNWVGRYAFHRGNRTSVAREFIEAAQTELLQRSNYPTPYASPW